MQDDEPRQVIRELSHTEFVSQLIVAYKNQSRKESITPVPLIVGAGISYSSGVPLDSRLMESVSAGIDVDDRSYDGIYDVIGKDVGQRESPIFKERLRELLNAGGLPRLKERPAPNVANLGVIHLLRSGVFGPVVSMNVDPLLPVADYFFDNETQPVRFVCNTSQFSEIGAERDMREPLVLQVHGSIEEPLSLRFGSDELAGSNAEIVRTVGTSMSRARARAVCCVGTSLKDGVVQGMLEVWAQQMAIDRAMLRLFIAFYDPVERSVLESLRDRLEKNIGRSGAEWLEINYTERYDADDFFSDVVTSSRKETKKKRGDGDARYYVPVMSDNLARALLFKLLAKRGSSPDQGWLKLPDDATQLAIDIVLHCVQSRGPFNVLDIARSSPRFRHLTISASDNRGRLALAQTIQRLCDHRVISFVEKKNGAWVFTDEASARASIGDMRRMHFARHQDAPDAERFVERCVDALSVPFGNAAERSEAVQRLVAMMVELEREREPEFVPHQAVSAAAYFDAPELVTSNRDLVDRLDHIKASFRDHAEKGRRVHCTVVTETGEHLFRPEALERLSDNPSAAEVAACLRDWIRVVFQDANSHARIRIFLARRDYPWLFGASEGEPTRAALEKKVAMLISRLRSSNRIDIAYVDFAHHNDHMWYFVVQDAQDSLSEGVYYPTNFDERAYYGVALHGFKNMQRLQAIEANLRLLADTEERAPTSYVLALSILNGAESSDPAADAKMLVCVRDPSSNGDHGDVASVPTKRIARAIYDEIAARVRWQMVARKDPEGSVKLCEVESLRDDELFSHNPGRAGDCVLRDAVCDLLSRKFNLGDALETGKVAFRAKPLVIRTGPSPRISANDSGEYISIINVLVLLDKGADVIPARTASYSDIAWVGANEFRDAARSEAPIVFPSGVSRQYGGLCVCSSDLLLHLRDVSGG
jgi:hypothetical protein